MVIPPEELATMLTAAKFMSPDEKLKMCIQCKSALKRSLKQAVLKDNPNIDVTYLEKCVAMHFITMIACSSAGHNYSRKKYDFCNAMLNDSEDYAIRHELGLPGFNSFYQIIDNHKGGFWEKELLNLTEYISHKDKMNIATYMFIFASIDGATVQKDSVAVYEILNKFY